MTWYPFAHGGPLGGIGKTSQGGGSVGSRAGTQGQRGGEVSGAGLGEHQYDGVAGFGEGTRSIVESAMPDPVNPSC